MMRTAAHGKPLSAARGRRNRKRINSFPIIINSNTFLNTTPLIHSLTWPEAARFLYFGAERELYYHFYASLKKKPCIKL